MLNGWRTFWDNSKQHCNNLECLALTFLLLSLLINARYPISRYLNNQESHVSFSENDELYYIRHASQLAEVPLGDFIFSAIDPGVVSSKTLALNSPYKLTLYFFGKVSGVLPLSAALFAYILDILFTFLSLCVFYHLFHQFKFSATDTLFASIVAVSFPWVFALQNLNISPNFGSFGLNFFSYSVDDYACLPSQRFGPTQISSIGFISSLSSLYSFLSTNGKRSYPKLVFAACLSGFCIYLYIFTFFVALTIGTLSIIALSLLAKESYLKTSKVLLTYLGLAMIVAAPGFPLSLAGAKVFDSALLPDGILHRMVGYSLEHIIFFILLIVAIAHSSSQKSKIVMVLICTCMVAHFCLYNLQTVTGKITTPYHFSLFFITPLMSGLIILYLFDLIQSAKIKSALGALIMMKVLLFNSYVAVKTANSEDPQDLEILRYAKTLGPTSKVAIIPFTKPFESTYSGIDSVIVLPSVIKLVSNIDAFPSNPALFAVERTEYRQNLEEEMLLGWLFSGTKRLAGSCSEKIDFGEQDLPQGIVYWSYHQRRDFCRYAKENFTPIDICGLLKKNKITHLLWDTSLLPEEPRNFNQIADKIWQSSQAKFIMLRIDSEKALNLACLSSIDTILPFTVPT